MGWFYLQPPQSSTSIVERHSSVALMVEVTLHNEVLQPDITDMLVPLGAVVNNDQAIIDD